MRPIPPDVVLMRARDESFQLWADLCDHEGLRDTREALVKLDGLAAILNELRAYTEQWADEHAEHPREALPPVEVVNR